VKELFNRKVLSAALCTVVASTAVLAGCSEKTEESKIVEEKSTASQTAAPAKKSKIRVSVYDRGQIPAGEGDFTKNRWTQWINENAPVEVEFVPVPRGEDVQKHNLLFASGSGPDLVVSYSGALRNDLFTQKQLRPLDDLLEKSTTYKKLVEQYPLANKMGMKPDGKIYDFSRITGLSSNHVLLVRQDWLDKLKLTAPATVEDFYNVAKAFTENDPDGNGKKDTLGTNISHITGAVIHIMFDSTFVNLDYNQIPYRFDANGKLINGFQHTKEAVDFKKRLFDGGFVDKDWVTDKNGEKAKQDWLNGKIGMYAANKGGYDLALYEALKKNNANAQVVAIPVPEGPYGKFSAAQDAPVQPTASVNSTAKDPEAVMKFVDWMSTESVLTTLKFGLEGVHWKKGVNGCPEIIDREKNKKEVDWNYDYWTPLGSTVLLGKCAQYEVTLDTKNPVQNEFLTIHKASNAAYLTKDRPVQTKIDNLPPLPQDLQLVTTNTGMADMWVKAIVGGKSYTAEQAYKDVVDLWNKRGGTKVEEFFNKYIDENKKLIYRPDVDNYVGM
jgi:putative aldouronate transport system substrate-binding protein